jgi:hypothetical protein
MNTEVSSCLTKPTYAGRVVNLSWKEINVLRITGQPTADLKGVMPWRMGPEKGHFGMFMIPVQIFSGGSARKATFLTAVVDTEGSCEPLDIETHQPPIVKFFNRVRNKAYNDPALKVALLDGGAGRAPLLSRPTQWNALVQGIRFMQDKTNPSNIKAQYPCIFVLRPSARQALANLLDEEVPNYTGDRNNCNALFKVGDFLNPDTGKSLLIFNPMLKKQAAPVAVDWNQTTDKGGGPREVSSYACELGGPIPLPRDAQGRIKLAVDNAMFTPWETCLRFMTEREQFDMVVDMFSDYPTLLCQIFSDRIEWLPKHIRTGTSISIPTSVNTAPTRDMLQLTVKPAAEFAGLTGTPDTASAANDVMNSVSASMFSMVAPAAATTVSAPTTIPAGANDINAAEAAALDKLRKAREAINK